MENKMYFHYKEETVHAVQEYRYCYLIKLCENKFKHSDSKIYSLSSEAGGTVRVVKLCFKELNSRTGCCNFCCISKKRSSIKKNVCYKKRIQFRNVQYLSI